MSLAQNRPCDITECVLHSWQPQHVPFLINISNGDRYPIGGFFTHTTIPEVLFQELESGKQSGPSIQFKAGQDPTVNTQRKVSNAKIPFANGKIDRNLFCAQCCAEIKQDAAAPETGLILVALYDIPESVSVLSVTDGAHYTMQGYTISLSYVSDGVNNTAIYNRPVPIPDSECIITGDASDAWIRISNGQDNLFLS